MMLVDGRRRVLSKFRSTEGQLVWFGRVNGRPVRPGTYEIRLRAFDRAGNRSSSRRNIPVVVRYIELVRERIEVAGGTSLRRSGPDRCGLLPVAVCGGARHSAGNSVLVLRAPETPGTYRVFVVASWTLRRQRRGRGDRARRALTSPLFVLGVSRSGTTLLRVVLDRSPGIAIPDESFFIPLLARRHRGNVDLDRFLDDLSRLPTLVAWGLQLDDIAARLRPGMRTGDAIAAIYEAYAASRRKAALGRQDADVHASPAAARAALPERAVRPPDPRRARRRALLPAHAGGHVHPDLGSSGHASRVRLPVADGGRGGARAGTTGRAVPVPGGSVRGSGRRRWGAW